MMINKRLINMTSTSKKYTVKNVFYQWISLLCNIISVFAIGLLLQQVWEGDYEAKNLVFVFATVSVMIGIRFLCNMLAAKMSYRSSSEIKDVLREAIYRKLLALGNGYQEKVTTSEVVQVSVEGVEQLEIYMGRYLPQFFYSVLAPVTLFVVLLPISVKAGVALLLCVPLIPMSIIAVQKFAKKLLNKYWSQYTGLGDHFLENLSGLTTLKIYGADERKHQIMNEEAETFRKVTMRVLIMQLNSISVMDLLAFGGAALGCIVAILELQAGNLVLWQAFVIIMLAAEFFIPLRLLGSYFHIAMNGMAASDKIFRLLDMEEETEVNTTNTVETPSIVLENIAFSYGDKNILDGVSLEAKAGNFVSLVGVSGSGKSTIASLLTGELKKESGKILLGGIPLEALPEEERMKNVTYLGFQSYIFAGTVEDTLLQGNPYATKEMMYEALRLVNLYDFVMEQGGLSMEVKEQGSNLSGGQRQRLAMARAFIHDSAIYIFDEATSNIDVESEEIIMDAIASLKGKKTVLCISHRLAQVKDSDCIYVLEDKRVKEQGTFEQLMRKQGAFAKMYEVQSSLERYRKGENETCDDMAV